MTPDSAPFFTVLIPAYKPNYLGEAIDSALGQTGFDGEWEVVVVDDASPHDVASVVKARMPHPRLRFERNASNFGAERLVDNWNHCLNTHVRGRYVINMGDDDRLMPGALAAYAELIGRHSGLAVYHGRTRVIDPEGRLVDITPPLPEVETVWEAMYRRLVHDRGSWIGDYVFDTLQLKQMGGYFFLPRAWGSDDVSVWRAAAVAGMGGTREPVFEYRTNPLTLSSNIETASVFKAIDGRLAWINAFLEANPGTDEASRLYASKLKAALPRLTAWSKNYVIGLELWPFSLKALMRWLRTAPQRGVTRRQVLAALGTAFKRNRLDR